MQGAASGHSDQAAESRAPGEGGTRLASLDFIRGFAVLGILAANIAGYALPSSQQSWPAALGALDSGSTLTWAVNFILVDGKMRSLFAILFGAGLALFIDRIDDRGEIGVLVQARRLFWLALFGIAHFLLLYRGDILFTYAFWGFFAMLLIRLRPGMLIAFGAALYLVFVPIDELRYRGALEADAPQLAQEAAEGTLTSVVLDPQEWITDAQTDRAIMGQGSLAQIIGYKIERHAFGAFSLTLDSLYDSFPMMLIGIALFRLGLFERGPGSRRLKQAGWGLFAVGLAIGLGFAWAPIQSGFSLAVTQYYGNALMPLQRLPMSIAWLFLLLAYLPALAASTLGERISAAGRMAFSNYIGSSLMMALIFQGWGLGLFARFDRLELAGFMLLGWIAMLAWSKPWLERYRYGPLEWLWRCLTYWRVFPVRR